MTELVLGIRLKQLSFGADPDTDLPFYLDTDQHLDPTPGFTHVGKKAFLYFFSQQCHPTLFIFPVSVVGVIIFTILNIILKFSGKYSKAL